MKQPFKKFLPLCLIVFVLSGCWDELNIEERGFVFGTALDLEKNRDKDAPIIALTNQFVVPSGIGSPESAGAGADEAFSNVTVKGESMAMISRNMATMGSRLPFYGHLKILVFSEELAKKENLIPSLSDFFIRGVHMRREVNVFIVEGEAKDVLKIEPTPEKIPANFIYQLLQHNDKSIETIDGLRIGTMQSYLLNETSYVLPKLKVTDGKVHSKGTAVFHGPDNKLVGSLNERETRGFNLVTQNNKEGTIKMRVDGELMVFDVSETKSNITLNVDDPRHVDVSIHVNADGFLEEMFGGESVLESDQLKKIGNKAADKMKELINETIEKSQKDLHADILDVGKTMKHKHYKAWKEVRDDWEKGKNYFDNTTFHVTVNAKVLDTGATDRAKEKGHED